MKYPIRLTRYRTRIMTHKLNIVMFVFAFGVGILAYMLGSRVGNTIEVYSVFVIAFVGILFVTYVKTRPILKINATTLNICFAHNFCKTSIPVSSVRYAWTEEDLRMGARFKNSITLYLKNKDTQEPLGFWIKNADYLSVIDAFKKINIAINPNDVDSL